MWTGVLTLLGSFMGVFVLFKYVLLMEVRLDAKTFKALYEIIKGHPRFLVNEEFITESKYPVIYQAFCAVKGCPLFYINHSERLLTAGFQGKELVTSLQCFRWRYQGLRDYLTIRLKELELSLGVPVELITPHFSDRIGMLKRQTSAPLLEAGVWQDFAREAEEVFSGKREKTGAILYGPPGNGKCLGKGTPVLMYDGTIKVVEDVRTGDLLMGPDSNPRKVLGTTTGRDKLYKVVPTKGDPYVVNESHILSLRMTADAAGHKEGDVVNLSVAEYLSNSNNFKHHAKGWRIGVEFTAKLVPIDPYILGLWLGDGTATKTEITTAEAPGRPRSGCNYLLNSLLRGSGNKRIPPDYKANSRAVRLQVLAGLIDTDGNKNCNCFDFVSKDKQLAEDVAYVARSLGFAAYIAPCIKNCQTGASGVYFRASISGDLSEVPVRLDRKQCEPRRQAKDVLVTGIELIPQGEGEYFGFELDGDGLFLLGDFTVTHNTSFAKYLATKYRVPIKLITFSPDFTNHDLMAIFSQIGSNCIVLFEDFDNYFDGRDCILGTNNNHIKFTFDIILNGLDGVYNTYERVVFIMTVNDIDKVDAALRSRPSRFKYVRCFDNPSEAVRRSLVPGHPLPTLNLDQIMRVKEYLEEGADLATALRNVNDIDAEESHRIAYLEYHRKARQKE